MLAEPVQATEAAAPAHHHTPAELDSFCNVDKPLTNPTEVEQIYNTWADDYEHESLDDYGFSSPGACAAAAAKVAKDGDNLLDLGCGTGLVGLYLDQKHGISFGSSTGCDLCHAMIDHAKEKGLYNHLQRLNMNELPWDLPSEKFDVVTCNGVLIYVENTDCLDEFLRVTKKGGHMCIMFRHDGYKTYQAKVEKLIADGKWELVHKSESQANFGKAESKAAASIMYNIWTFRKC